MELFVFKKARSLDLNRLFALSILALLLLGCLSCGRKSGPRPPEDTAPQTVKFLSVRGTVDGISLSWTAPSKDASGDSLIDLAGFIVERSIYRQGEGSDFEEVADIEVRRLRDKEAESEVSLLDSREEQSKLAEQYLFEDTEVKPGEHYEYVVYPYNEDGVRGLPSVILRGRFLGESSVFESINP